MHTQNRPYECCKCSKKFNNPSNMKRHFRIVHEKFRSDVCKVCGKAFIQSSDLRRHLLLHSGSDCTGASFPKYSVQNQANGQKSLLMPDGDQNGANKH